MRERTRKGYGIKINFVYFNEITIEGISALVYQMCILNVFRSIQSSYWRKIIEYTSILGST